MYDAFLSYARADIALLTPLTTALETNHLHPFLDQKSLRGGEDWPPQIGRALKSALAKLQ